LQRRRGERARRWPDGVIGKARNLKSAVGALLVLLCPRGSMAGTFVAFGPETYRHAPGQPTAQSTSFPVLTPATTYTLRIHNGGLSNEFSRVSSAVITLNGVEVARPNDFNQNVALLEKPVMLAATNTLTVEVRGPPEGGFTLQIIGVDTDPPTLSATATPPANAAGWNHTAVTVIFTCADAISGIATCPAPVTVNTDGVAQVLSGTAVDHAGNIATASLTLNLDTTPPTLTPLITPAPNAAGWNKAAVTVDFLASDALSGLANLTPRTAVTTEGAAQVLTGTASDLADNHSTASATVNLDTTLPSLTITEPPTGTLVRKAEITLSGTVNDSLSGVAAVSCNGSAGTVSGAAFACPLTLTSGTNTLQVQVSDVAGHTAHAATVVTFVPGPEVTITDPPTLSAFNRSSIAVTGAVAAEAVEVWCNDTLAGLTNGGFGASVSLKEGNNTITCVALDATGQAGTASITVTLDTTPPRVTINAPRDGALLTAAPVTVMGMINDIVVGTVNVEEARVECNGVSARVANRAFVAVDVPLNSGPNNITCTGIDRAGNVDTERIGVTLETAASAKITLVSGNNQTGHMGELVPEPLVVMLTENGVPAAGKAVRFKILRNDGTLSAGSTSGRALTVHTDANGRAEVQFTLGTWAGAGNNQVEATAVGFVGEALFSASALPADPGLIVVDAGNNQEGIVGQHLPRPFVATVVDRGSNRLGNVSVTFTVTQGGGSFAGQPVVTVPTDSDGRAQVVLTLGPAEGFDNNVVKATFPDNAGAPATFVASGKIAGNPAETQISGVVLDNTNVPIPGVTLHIEGSALTAQSDKEGQFVLQPAPVGHVKLIADGTTAQRPGTWPKLEYELVTIPGHHNTIGMPIYLLPLDLPHGLLVDETQGGTLTLPEVPGFALTVAPGSATFPDGSKRGLVSVTVVHADKVPMVPNFGQQPRFIITIQPAGTHFNPPAALTLPNVDGLAPGQKTEMYSFDHDLGQFVSIGPGTVSEDGTVLSSDPGVGVLKGGWHCGGNPAETGGAEGAQVEVFPQTITLAVGGTAQVTAIGRPAPGAKEPFTWESEDPGVVEVVHFHNVEGDEESMQSIATLEGRAPGTATVTVAYTCESDTADTAEVEVNVIDVQVQSADVIQDSIVVQLSPSEVSGILRLELLGSTTHVIREELRAGGTHNETFDIPNLAVGEYTQVRATWTVETASASGELDYHIEVLGQYHHTQYNSPLESECTGSDRSVYILANPGMCFDDFSPGTLKSGFVSQVNLNGSGHSLNYGDVKALAATRCRTETDNRPPDATGNSFVQIPVIDGACGVPPDGTTVAGCLASVDSRGMFACGDQVYIHRFGVKTVVDHCPACCGADGQLDNYTSMNGGCSGHAVGDLTSGRPMTIRLLFSK